LFYKTTSNFTYSNSTTNAIIVSFLTFESSNENEAVYESSAGSFIPNDDNPLRDTINPSIQIGRYIRNIAIQNDSTLFSLPSLRDDASACSAVEMIFTMDLFSYDATEETEIILILQAGGNDTNPTSNSNGKHSRYRTIFQQQSRDIFRRSSSSSFLSSWQRVHFVFLDQPDETVDHSDISHFVLSFAPVVLNGSTY